MTKRYVLQMRKVPFEDFSSLEPDYSIILLDSLSESEKSSFYAEILPRVEAIIATGPVNSELIAKALSLKVIVVNGAGYDDIDVAAATALRIPVYNIPDITSQPTAELALTLMLCVSRRVAEMDRWIRNNPQSYGDLFNIGANPGHTLEGKTLGIVGLGHIGMALARMCWSLNMNILYYNRKRLDLSRERSIRYVPFEMLLANSDVISLHCPLTEKTNKLFNEDAFMRMKSGAILINTSRGAVVDQDQMVRFLEAGKLAGAGLDVFPDEPNIHPKLLKMDNVVLTPHYGTNTVETRTLMAQTMSSIIRAVCDKGLRIPGNLINPDALRKPRTGTEHDTQNTASDPSDLLA